MLAPALAKVATRKVFLVAPPHPPQALALAALGLAPQNVVWIKSERTADTLWAAEQVLRGSAGALLWPVNKISLKMACSLGEKGYKRDVQSDKNVTVKYLGLSYDYSYGRNKSSLRIDETNKILLEARVSNGDAML